MPTTASASASTGKGLRILMIANILQCHFLQH
jgi:hypothetical protein